VPLISARLEGIPDDHVYYVEEGHGSLPNNDAVGRAVVELLGSGRTEELPTSLPAGRRQARDVSEHDLRSTGQTLESALASVTAREALRAVTDSQRAGPRQCRLRAAVGHERSLQALGVNGGPSRLRPFG
jgi:hypothetical protein